MSRLLSPREFVSRSGARIPDDLFEKPRGEFAFDEDVTEVFPNMIGRSVPLYWETVDMIGEMTAAQLKENQVVYDLGCSLGAVGWSIDRNLETPVKLIAVDASQPMVDRLTANLQGLETRAIWTVKCADVTKVDFEPCDVIILNYCLQFIPISQRPHLLRRLYAALKPGGSLYLSEKVHETNKQMNQRLRTHHHAFKKAQGYSDEEIENKAESIKVMMPTQTDAAHKAILKEIGFSDITTWMRWLNFTSIWAVK